MTTEARGSGLRLAAATLLGLLAMGRTLVMVAGQRWFDVDPSVDPNPLSALGPAGSQLVDVLLLLAAGAGVVGLWRGGMWGRGRVAAWAWTLLVPAAVVLLWHGRGTMDAQWIGSSWIAAAVAGAVAFGLARERGPRAVLVALLLAAMVPVAARGLMQVRVGPWVGPEHAQTLDEWGAQRRAFFADRGWTEDSPAARIFERRLRQPQPTGWFATTNVFATMAGVSVLLGAGLAAGAWRVRTRPEAGAASIVVPAAVAAGGLGLLMLTGAKGAWAATLLGGGVLAVGAAATRVPVLARGLRLAGPWLAVLVIPGMLGLTVLRGVLPEDFAGDRSLLFRWHYLQGAAATVAESPLAGVGADGFQSAYLLHRPMRSPEEVSSVHAVAADWLVAAGIAAAGWLAVLGFAAWRMGGAIGTRGGDSEAADSPGPSSGPLADLALATGIGAVTLAAMLVEFGRLDGLELMSRLVGGAGAIVVAVTVRRVLADRADAVPRVIFAGAGLLAIAHAQIEMTATQPGAATWWAVLMGVCAAAAGSAAPTPVALAAERVSRPAPIAAGSLIGVLVIVTLIAGVLPAARQGTQIARAAASISEAAAVRNPVDAAVRVAAAEALQAAAAIQPVPRWIEPVIIRQYTMAIRGAATSASREAARLAAIAAFPSPDPLAEDLTNGGRIAFVDLLEARADAGEPDAMSMAVDFARAARTADPHGTGAAARLAGLLARAGRPAEAAAAARDALAIDDAKELDPAKQLGPRRRGELERIAASASASAPDATSG